MKAVSAPRPVPQPASDKAQTSAYSKYARLIPPGYEIIHRCGEGTYGVVHLCKTRTGRHAAVKTIKQDGSKQEAEGIPITTVREASLLRELHHPNILTLDDVHVSASAGIATDSANGGASELAVSLVFEFVEHDLHELMQFHRGHGHPGQLRQQPLRHFPPSMVASMMWQLLRGLAYLHDSCVIHRDLKPSNLLITAGDAPRPGVLKIADFGLARVFRAPPRPLADNGVVVTVWYRAPELLLGARHYTPAVDVWAAGCIFAELLTLSALFPGNEVREPLNAFQTDQLARVTATLGPLCEADWPTLAQLPHWVEDAHGVRSDAAAAAASGTRGRGLEAHLFALNPALEGEPRSAAALALIRRMLTYDPAKRITALQALRDDYFLRDPPPSENVFPPAFKPRYASKAAREAAPKAPRGSGTAAAAADGHGGAGGHGARGARGASAAAAALAARRVSTGGAAGSPFRPLKRPASDTGGVQPAAKRLAR